TVTAGSFITYQLCVTPRHTGALTASLSIKWTAGGLDRSLTVPIDVTAFQACAHLATTATLFVPGTPIGNSDTAEVRVKNCSVLPTTFTGTLSAPLPGYSIIGGGNSVTVAAGDTAVFMLAFTPSLQGRDTGTFTVTTPGV